MKKCRVGWVTTWNVKCGIASHVGHLLEAVSPDDFVILAARDKQTLGPDQHNCVRCWATGKGPNGLGDVARELEARGVGALVIHFNYGFFNHFELNDFIQSVVRREIYVFIELHSTVDPLEEENWRLRELLPALKMCHRIVVHGPADMNRLKGMGLVENVMLMPHGIYNPGLGASAWSRGAATPLVASFGFSFANKGLLQLVRAAALLRNRGQPIRLLMLNAQHANPESANVVREVKTLIARLELQEAVDLRTEYLDDRVCLELLSRADLVVNPYQMTSESASAAVRYALAAGRPVAVTPLPIFDDLGNAVFRMPGITPDEIAQGIAGALKHIHDESDVIRNVYAAACRWVEENDVAQQGARLMRTAMALSRRTGSHSFKEMEEVIYE